MVSNSLLRTLVTRALPILVCALLAGAQDVRTPVPNGESVAEQTKRVRELHKSVYASDSNADLAALAAKLRAAASGATDATERYVLLSEAVELAAKARDGAAALGAIDDLAKQFRVPAGEMSVRALRKCLNGALSPEELARAPSLWLHVTDTAMAAEDYVAARSAATDGCSAARKAGDAELATQLTARAVDLRDLGEWHASAEKAERALHEDSTDAAAHFALGRYWCLGRGNWADGRPHLIQGNQPRLRVLAERDVASPSEPGEQVELADAWWDFGVEHDGRTRVGAQQRARDWYSKALPRLTGLEAQRIHGRLDEVDAQSAACTVVIELPSSKAITESTCLLSESFHLTPDNRVKKYTLVVPEFARRTGTLRIVVKNMGDDSGDQGMFCELKNSKGARMFRNFDFRDRSFSHPAKSRSRWTLILEDLDTTGNGNGGTVEVWIDPG